LDTPVTTTPPDDLSFPRQQARTGRFTRGAPRAATVSRDGSFVAFLRSASGTDPAAALWVLDVASGTERRVADPVELLAGGAEELSAAERARRERTREGGAGIVAYATDRAGRTAAFALSGRLFVVDLTDASAAGRELAVETPVVDPRPSPDGSLVAYVAGGALRVVGADGTNDRALVEPDGPDVTWGVAEFIAAEEMQRYRGYWWSPDGSRLLAARVDESPVQRWWVADPANPQTEPVPHAYPAAGTPNADVRLAIVPLDGDRVDVTWDRAVFEYLVTAGWHEDEPYVLVQSRDQRTTRLLTVDTATGETRLRVEDQDPVWVEIVPGVPDWCGDQLVTVADREGWRRLLLDGRVVTPDGLQLRTVRSVDDTGVLFTASTEPAEIHLWSAAPDGTLTQLTSGAGIHGGTRAGGTTVITSATLDAPGTRTEVRREGAAPVPIRSYAQRPVLEPRVELSRVTDRALPTALVLPRDHDPAGGPLPVLLDPYGGPHAQRVVASADAYLTSQWFADQGFAVVIVDGVGTPGRGYDVERAVAGDLATGVLADQVDALHALAAQRPELDLSRVAIRGWSFGGLLAALAVLCRPDVFHAAVAGAPVTDQRLYDTHYTERYLGDPTADHEAYERSSPLTYAATLERPLMLIHGLADDNVVAAHTLRMSSALLAAGRAHTVLPLSGVTHMTPQEEVAENLLLLQVEFLHAALA